LWWFSTAKVDGFAGVATVRCVLHLSPAELEARFGGGDPFDGAALVVVDGAVGDDAAARLETVPTVVVGFDVDASGDELDSVARVVEDHPDAAVGLVLALRGSERRSVAEQLLVESLAYATLQGGPDHAAWLAGRTRRDRPPPPAPVRLERSGDRLDITLADPDRRNAYSAAMRDALIDALAVAAADPALDVRLRGDGPSFCAGGDLDEFGTVPDSATAHRIRMHRSAGRALAELADRVTVEVHGACVGAGVELPAFARHVVAAPDTTFRLPEIAMGLIPGAGGTASLPRRIGRRRTALLALLGQPIDATTALEWGLVDELS
jgi:hypothetical protein